jgi:hypothetical protein
MEYESIINKYRQRFRNKKILLFIDFLETLYEWVERLYELKRFKADSTKEVEDVLPKLILTELNKLPSDDISEAKYAELKQILLGDTTKLVNAVIAFSDMRLSDFDILQFNLYQIFGKEEIASMVEWARLHLQEEIERKKKEEAAKEVGKKEAWDRYLKHIRSLSDSDLRKRAIKIMFDFTPSARTTKERSDTLTKNRNKIFGHRKTFHKFEEKLIDATVEARAQSELNVYTRMGEVKRHMDVTADKFKKKAAEFASAEGPKKRIGDAREKIQLQSETLKEEMTTVGKEWELNFMIDVASARDKISTASKGLSISLENKGKEWRSQFQKDIEVAQKKIRAEQTQLYEQRTSKGAEIQAHGEEEFEKASLYIGDRKADFSEDIDVARKKFEGKEEEMGEAKDSFIEKRDVAADAFLSRGAEIETEMFGTIYHEKNRFMREREVARAKFYDKGSEIQSKATTHILGRKQDFIGKREEAQKRFIDARGLIQKKGTLSPTLGGQGSEMAKARKARGRVEQANYLMTEEGKKRRDIMQKKIKHQRDQFQYDVRFAQHRIKENSKDFGEKILQKQEEFVSQGAQLVARHKAKQKAHLIRNLLRTIRTTH